MRNTAVYDYESKYRRSLKIPDVNHVPVSCAIEANVRFADETTLGITKRLAWMRIDRADPPNAYLWYFSTRTRLTAQPSGTYPSNGTANHHETDILDSIAQTRYGHVPSLANLAGVKYRYRIGENLVGDDADDDELMVGDRPLEVNITTPAESEIQLGGDAFLVKIRSTAPLGEIVQHARELYLELRPAGSPTQAVGFAAPAQDLRPTPDYLPGTMDVPLPSL